MEVFPFQLSKRLLWHGMMPQWHLLKANGTLLLCSRGYSLRRPVYRLCLLKFPVICCWASMWYEWAEYLQHCHWISMCLSKKAVAAIAKSVKKEGWWLRKLDISLVCAFFLWPRRPFRVSWNPVAVLRRIEKLDSWEIPRFPCLQKVRISQRSSSYGAWWFDLEMSISSFVKSSWSSSFFTLLKVHPMSLT